MGKVKERIYLMDELYIESGGSRWVHYYPVMAMQLLVKLKVLKEPFIDQLCLDKVINSMEHRAFIYCARTGRILGDDKDADGSERD